MLTSPVYTLKGVGSVRAKLFGRLGIETVEDLLYYFPRGHEDRSNIKTIFEAIEGETVCIKATVFSPVTKRPIRKGLTIYQAILYDDTGSMTASWFNNRFIANMLKKGSTYIFYGKISRIGGKKNIENPIFEPADKAGDFTGRIVPLYPLTAGLTQKAVQTAMKSAMPAAAKLVDPLPHFLRTRYRLAEIGFAMENIHFPKDFESYELARRRFVFEELLILQLSLLFMKSQQRIRPGQAIADLSYRKQFEKKLPFEFTAAQSRVLDEICRDLSGPVPMNRLVQGDVGSGKTAVAACAMYITVKNGFQASLMAPTEILAEQHYENFKKMLGDDCNICLVTGSMPAAEKARVTAEIASGKADIIIGTHAIIQQNIEYYNLALTVTDEQHRFGVNQRNAMVAKGKNPHVLVMSATPIPRTLALILYGDLDISIIDSLPPGRKKIDTYAVDESMRPRIYNFIRKHISQGRQAYIVCPLVEESESLDLKNASEYAKHLQNKVFPDFTVALLHGKQKTKEKEGIMSHFKAGQIDILVSTTVVEVGVDVPNANIMVIENAERFGLSQLHQLRGRVGRGDFKSYCILFNQSDSPLAKERMKTMCESNDGFVISEKDLKLRGPGDFFGTRQHGLPSMKIANLFTDIHILKEAQQAAEEIITADPALESDKHMSLKSKISKLISKVLL